MEEGCELVGKQVTQQRWGGGRGWSSLWGRRVVAQRSGILGFGGRGLYGLARRQVQSARQPGGGGGTPAGLRTVHLAEHSCSPTGRALAAVTTLQQQHRSCHDHWAR